MMKKDQSRNGNGEPFEDQQEVKSHSGGDTAEKEKEREE